jgi:hypothetical protein
LPTMSASTVPTTVTSSSTRARLSPAPGLRGGWGTGPTESRGKLIGAAMR